MGLDHAARLAKNKRISESKRGTQARRASLRPSTYELKLTTRRLTPEQAEGLRLAFLEAKWLKNAALASGELEGYDAKAKSVPVKTPEGLEDRTLDHLGSQVKQALLAELGEAKRGLAALKTKGHRVGKIRFFREVRSLPLKQPGATFRIHPEKNQVFIQKLGWFPARGLHQVRGKDMSNAKLVKRASGYYLLVTAFAPAKARGEALEAPGGGDLGKKTHLTTSWGREFHCLVEETRRLKGLQRKLARQKKGSNSWQKTRLAIQREYERVGRRKDALARAVVNELRRRERFFLQGDDLSGWKTKGTGGAVQHGILGRLKALLAREDWVTILPRWVATTAWCPACGTRTKHDKVQRVFVCGNRACAHTAPRDLHAARNMVLLGERLLAGKTSKAGLYEPVGNPRDWGDSPVEGKVSREGNRLSAHPEEAGNAGGPHPPSVSSAAPRRSKRRPLQGRP